MNAGCVGDEDRMGDLDEEATFHNAHHAPDTILQPSGIGDATEPTVEDSIAAVGYERPALWRASQPGVRAEARQRRLCCLDSKGYDLDRYWSAGPELLDQFGSVHDDHEPPARDRHDFLVKERTAQSLDQIERAPFRLIRAVNREIDLPMLCEGREWNSCDTGQGCRAVGGRDAEEAQALPVSLSESLDGKGRR
jgi:hypothetical protein